MNRLGAFGLCLVLASCATADGYKGSGELEVLHRFPALAIKIDFEQFTLDQPLTATYSIEGIPRLNYTYYVGLAVPDISADDRNWPPESLRTRFSGTIRFELRSSHGTVRTFEAPTESLYWTGLNGSPPVGLATPAQNPTAAYFHPRDLTNGDEYVELRVIYAPTVESDPVVARISIMSDVGH